MLTDLTDPTVLLCGWKISQTLLRVGCAHADSASLGSHGSHRSHGIALWVGNLTDASACGLCSRGFRLFLGSHGSHRSHSIALWVENLTDASARVWTYVGSDGGTLLSLSLTYLSDPSDKSDLSDLSDKLDIFKNNP